MINLSSADIPNIDQYEENIGAYGTSVAVDTSIIESLAIDFSARCASATNILNMYLSVFSEGKYCNYSADRLISTLVDYCGCKRSSFTNFEGNPSLDMKTVVLPLIDALTALVENKSYQGFQADNALTLLTAYKDYKELYTRRNTISSKLKKCVPYEEKGWNGQLSQVKFRYEQKDTGRYYTRDDSIQNWPLEMCKAITVPQDYFLFWSDFNQIDFRVGYHLYLREPGSEADKIYLAADDKYRAMYEIICRSAGKEPNFELFTTYRKAYKKAILSAMYNASEKSLIEDIKNRELGHELYEYFRTNKRYQQFRRSIDRLINFNVDAVITDYFGYTRTIPMPNLKNNRDVNDAISKCCNTPIQSTSNSIMILWLEKTLELFEKHGYNRKEHVIPYLIRHDECIFKVHKSVFKDIYLFKEAMSVAIDDWDVITLEPHLGRNYKEPWDKLELAFETSCIQNSNKINSIRTNVPRETPYRPIQEVLDVYVYDMTPIVDRAKANYNPSSVSLPDDLVDSIDCWTEEQAIQVISEIVKEHPEYTELKNILEFRNYCLVYSSKLNAYMLCNSLDYAIAAANKIGTNKINLYNTGVTSSMMHEGIMFKISSSCRDKVKQLFNSIRDMNYPSGWVTL